MLTRSLTALVMTSPFLTGQDYALCFNGGSVTLPHNSAMLTGTTCTIEAWVRAETTATGQMIVYERYETSAEHKSLGIDANGSIRFEYAGSPWAHGLGTAAGVFPFDGAFHHVAFSRRADGTYSLHLDGVELISAGPGPCWLTCNIIGTTTATRIVSDPQTTRGWAVDSLRVSTSARYAGTFTPSRALAADPATVLLLNFREGQGAITADQSQVGQTGTLSPAGVTWSPNGLAGSFTPRGLGCVGNNGLRPSLAAAPASVPAVGRAFLMTIAQTSINPLDGLVFGMLGFASTPPIDLAPLGMPGCHQLIMPGQRIWPLLAQGGTASWPLAIPVSCVLRGATVHVQAVCQDRAANPTGLTVTNAGVCVVGS